MKYEVLVYGNGRLRDEAVPVQRVDDDIRRLAADMEETMYASEGLGLAAEQVGRREAMFVADVPPRQDTDAETGQRMNPDVAMPVVLINPRLTESYGEQVGQEGCLSFPGIYVTLKRADEVEVTFMDLEGEERTMRARGLLARVLQHELDHLNGVLLVDRMSPVQKVAVAGKLKKLRRDGRAPETP